MQVPAGGALPIRLWQDVGTGCVLRTVEGEARRAVKMISKAVVFKISGDTAEGEGAVDERARYEYKSVRERAEIRQ